MVDLIFGGATTREARYLLYACVWSWRIQFVCLKAGRLRLQGFGRDCPDFVRDAAIWEGATLIADNRVSVGAIAAVETVAIS